MTIFKWKYTWKLTGLLCDVGMYSNCVALDGNPEPDYLSCCPLFKKHDVSETSSSGGTY
jgi:hypothetical protein